MIYGFIIAAGNQSRFNSELPKALVSVGNSGVPLLHYNITMMNKYCDKVFVVCSHKNKVYFTAYNSVYNDANLIVIDSGLGCGDAIYKALCNVDIYPNDRCFIQWGDSIQKKSTYDKVAEYATYSSVVIPCTIEDSPYVQIKPDGENRVKVLFSKFGDPITKGYHDLSLFYCNCYDLFKAMESIVTSWYNGVDYNMNNREYSFLDTFNYTDISVDILDVGEVGLNSFNTVEDLINLEV
jgi:hypothetical protein